MKLFPKLALMVSCVVLGAMLWVSLSYYWSEQREIRRQARTEQEQALQSLAHIARESFLTDDDLLLVKYIRLLLQLNPEMTSASVVDELGMIRAHSEPSRIGRIEKETPTDASTVLVLSASVKTKRRVFGTASVGFSQAKLDEKLRGRLAGLRRRIVSATCLGLFLCLFACFGIALSWTRPIQGLAKGADEIGQGKWNVDLGRLEDRQDELGLLAKSFQGMAVKLGELDRMKEDFVSAVTHELQSPLSAIESFLNLMDDEEKDGISPDDLRDYHQCIRVNTQRLSRFVNDLLDVSAIERGKIYVNSHPMDTAALAKDVLVFFEPKLKEKRIAANLECPEPIPWAMADPDKIRQVLINLVANAMKFTPEKGHIEISIEDLPSRKLVRFCVTDTGIGINAIDQLKIFNKFEQVQSARQHVNGPKGTGLGLAICRELIQLHGGEIGVTSQLGQGSTFHFTLPAAEVPPALNPPRPKETVSWKTEPLSM